MKQWQLQKAKAHLSEVVREATLHGPQEITLRGEPTVVIISKVAYLKLTVPKKSFLRLMQESPLKGLNLRLTRNSSVNRDIDL